MSILRYYSIILTIIRLYEHNVNKKDINIDINIENALIVYC